MLGNVVFPSRDALNSFRVLSAPCLHDFVIEKSVLGERDSFDFNF